MSGRSAFLRGVSVGTGCLMLMLASASLASERTEAPEDEDLHAQIEAQLAELPEIARAKIRVAVRDGHVVLQGQVRLLEQLLRAEQTVWTTPGVRDVDNELQVVPLAAGADAAIERQVRMIVKSDGPFIDTNLQIEVLAGVVRLQGMFQDPSDVLTLKHQIAKIPGVLAVEIDALLVASRDDPGESEAS